MRIYIIEDDISVISILEDIVEQNELGVICGTTEDGYPGPEPVLAARPDLVLIDLLMPEKDGIEVVRELREEGCPAKFVMISQVSAKEMVAKAYLAGVDFFIQKPINLIEVRQVVGNIRRQIQSEQALRTIRSVFSAQEPAAVPAAAPAAPDRARRRRIQYLLGELGMAGEKGSQDILDMCMKLLEMECTASQVGVSALCAQMSASPRSMEQRARRAVERGLRHVASLGLEDFGNETFTRCAAHLFPFAQVRAEMAALQGKGDGGKVNLKKFLDGILMLTEEEH